MRQFLMIFLLGGLLPLSLGAQSYYPVPPRQRTPDVMPYFVPSAAPRHLVAPRKLVGSNRNLLPKVPVILVNFQDMTFRTSRTQIDSMFNATGAYTAGAQGSVRKYFSNQSNGLYVPQFDLYGPITVSQNYAHYGAHGSSSDIYPGELVAEACAIMDDSLNFADYDLNADNKVDIVYILYAGPGEQDLGFIDPLWISTADQPKLIWPHCWDLNSAGTNGRGKVFDGKTVDLYEVSCELDGVLSDASVASLCGIGLACHEFCHGLGLPDMYTTNGALHKTLGTWSLLDQGIYNNDMMSPPNLSAYERWFMGWIDPVLLTEPQDVTLEELGASNQAYIISATGTKPANILTPNPSTFYLLENRQQEGWDDGIPGHGLMLTKITWSSSLWSGNSVNNTARAMGVDIIEADGLAPAYNSGNPDNGYFGKQGDLYPCDTITSISVLPDYPITDIQEKNGVITFKFMGGASPATDMIPSIMPDTRNTKYIHNGRLIIEREGRRYTILGYIH